MSRYDYDEDVEHFDWRPIADRWVRARKAHSCSGGCSGIVPGETYHRVVGVFEGDFTVHVTCGYCEHGHPRPGSPEEAELIRECAAQAAEDEADYQADLDFARRYVADHPDAVADPVWQHCRAELPVEAPA